MIVLELYILVLSYNIFVLKSVSIYIYIYIYNTFMWKIMFGLIVASIAAEGGLMKPIVAAVRRLDFCGCSKQR